MCLFLFSWCSSWPSDAVPPSTSASSIIALRNEVISRHTGADAAKENTSGPWLWSMPASPPHPLHNLADGIRITTCIMRRQLSPLAPRQPCRWLLPYFQAEAGKPIRVIYSFSWCCHHLETCALVRLNSVRGYLSEREDESSRRAHSLSFKFIP